MIRPRVLHVLEALEGGTARHLIDIVTHVAASHLVALPPRRIGALTDETATSRLRKAGAEVCVVPMHRTPWSPANALAVARLRRLIRTERPDLLHLHSSIGGLLGGLAGIRSDVPTIYTPNGITQSRAGILAERLLRRGRDVVVAVSPSEASLARQLRLATAQQTRVIPNGIGADAPTFPLILRAHLGIPTDAPLVGTIARLVRQKAPTDFVRACGVVAQHLPDAHFVLIGGGPLEAEVDAEVDRAGLGDVFHRITAMPDAAGVLGQLDVFVLASQFEGGPYAPLEAMRAGTAVVVTDVVGSRDTVVRDESGLIVPSGDPQSLGEATLALLRDPQMRSRLEATAQERVATSFDVRQMAASLDELYGELCRHGRVGR